MKTIDFEVRGNMVRIFLGKDNLRAWWGDDWDNAPYEHNAETVYDEYVAGYIDVAFPFDAIVLEPSDGVLNSSWSKQDMQRQEVPMFAVLPCPSDRNRYGLAYSFQALMSCQEPGVCPYYMGVPFDATKDLPDGAVILQTVMKDNEEYLSGLRDLALRRLSCEGRMGNESIGYVSRLAWGLFLTMTDDVDGLTCSDITERIIMLVDRPGNEKVVKSLRDIIGVPSFIYPLVLSEALFGTHDTEYPAKETQVTAQLIELIKGDADTR